MTPIKAIYNGIQDGPHPFELWTSAQVPADTLYDWKHVLVARQALAQAEGK